jgi:hypothetical protein
MYSAESIHERFSTNPPDENNCDHFIAVKCVSGQWKYDDGEDYQDFDPTDTDVFVLVAAVNFSTSVIDNLKGVNDVEEGIVNPWVASRSRPATLWSWN